MVSVAGNPRRGAADGRFVLMFGEGAWAGITQ